VEPQPVLFIKEEEIVMSHTPLPIQSPHGGFTTFWVVLFTRRVTLLKPTLEPIIILLFIGGFYIIKELLLKHLEIQFGRVR